MTESFYREYPRSKPAKWTQSKEGWSVSFQDNDNNNGEAMAYFDASGKHLKPRYLMKKMMSRFP
ncbi:MAG: hypothetical protein WDM78_15830 [Puia sp.]